MKKLELYGNNALATQKLQELGQASAGRGNSGEDAFLLSQPINDCFSFTLKIHKFNKGKNCNLVYK